jgi:O-antigen biosynthesis protein
MHRSGTSAVARGLQELSVYLGNDFLEAQFENPTGYWEDKGIVELNERVLKTLRLSWDDVAPIARRRFAGWRMWRLRREAVRYLRRRFTPKPLWGFKDPRTMRLLPFWRRVFRDCNVEDSYVLVIRNPMSVAASLFRRQAMDLEATERLWLLYNVPFLQELADKALVVLDYDLFMQAPRAELERVGRRLNLAPQGSNVSQIERFTSEFLDEKLRHTLFSAQEIDSSTELGLLTRNAYEMLYDLAADRRGPDSDFWSDWERLARRLRDGVR